MILRVAEALAGVLLAQALATAPAWAQQRSQDDDSITIIGKSPPKLRQEVTDYVQKVGVALGERPAGRWLDPVCPHVIGLSPEQAARVEAQVRSIAQSIGAPLAKAGCKGNLVLAFTADAPALVQQIAKRERLGDVSHRQRKELETSSAPIRWWYSNEVRGEDGLPTEGAAMSPALRTEAPAGMPFFALNAVPSNDRSGTTNERVASLIATSTQRAIRQATIVVDATRARGKALTSLVDYAAMVGLAEIQLGADPPNSVLSMFKADGADRLSKNDLALLRGLYSLQLTRKSDQHRRVLVGKILKERMEP